MAARDVARRRRELRNQRTYAGGVGAFIVGWLVTTSSVIVTVGERDANSAFADMVTWGVVCLSLLAVAASAVAFFRMVIVRLHRRFDRTDTIGRLAHLALGVATIATLAVSGGSFAYIAAQPVGVTPWAAAIVFGAAVAALFVAAAFLLTSADDRRLATTSVLREHAAATRIAQWSEGEFELMGRTDRLESLVTQLLERPVVSDVIHPRSAAPARFESWCAWFRARPRRRPPR